MFGKEHAERILSARRKDSEKHLQQVRKSESLRSGIPLFFSRLGEQLKQSGQEFNAALDLFGDRCVQVYSCDSYVTLTKLSPPVFIRKIALVLGTDRARVTTEIVNGLCQPDVSIHEYLFDARYDGTIELDRRDSNSFAKYLFDDVARRFR